MIEWDSIDTVLLDMDGTLLDLHFDNYFWTEHLPEHHARQNQLDRAHTIQELQDMLDIEHGTLAWYSLDYWSECLQMDLPALKQELAHMIRLRPYVTEFLARLKETPREVLLVTNAHRKTLDIKMAQVDIRHWFDRMVVSHDLDTPKEQPEFWEKLQALHAFDPTRTLLIDDTEGVLLSAQAYGITHLLTLLQPDSQAQMRLDTRFPGIHHFDEIMPEASA